MYTPSAASFGRVGRSDTITSGIPEPAATAAILAVQISPKGFTVSVTLILGSCCLQMAMIRWSPLRRTGEAQKCQISMSPETSALYFTCPGWGVEVISTKTVSGVGVSAGGSFAAGA